MSLAKKIHTVVTMSDKPVTLNDLYTVFKDETPTTIRGRVYDNIGKLFKRVDKGVYVALGKKGNKALVVQGDGRNLSEIPDEFIDAIITDHPWKDEKSNKGTNRHFDKGYADSSFKYKEEDFKEKFRVLKEGGFLVENLPEENANNWEYIFSIKKMATNVGFEYFCQVPWTKGNLVNNTGRKSKNSETLLFMTKGKPRCLRQDIQREKLLGKQSFMSGAAKMLPIAFDYQPKRDKRHPAEKPVELLEDVIEHITLENEIVLDQFAGSLNIILAALRKNRNCIAYELDKKYVDEGLMDIETEFEVIKEDQ